MSLPRGSAPLACLFYRAGSGAEPVRSWLKKLERAVRLEIGADIQKVQWRWPVSRPLVGSMGGGLYEVRTSHEGDEYRVLFCVEDGAMILLHGFQKRTRKTPDRELRLARERHEEVMG